MELLRLRKKLAGSAELISATSYEIRTNKFRTFLFRTLLFSFIVLLLSGRFSGVATTLLHIATGNYGYLKCCFYFNLKIKLFDHILVVQNFWKSVAEIFFVSSLLSTLISRCSYGMITLCLDWQSTNFLKCLQS